MIPEAAALRRELRVVHARLDGSLDVNECLLVSTESLHLEAVEAKAGWDKSEGLMV